MAKYLLSVLPTLHYSLGLFMTTDAISNTAVSIIQGDHLSGKHRNVREFDSCQGQLDNLTAVKVMSGILLKIWEMSGNKSCQGKVA